MKLITCHVKMKFQVWTIHRRSKCSKTSTQNKQAIKKKSNYEMYELNIKLVTKILLSSNEGNSLTGIARDISLQARYNFSHSSNNVSVLTVALIATSPSWISAHLWMNELARLHT